MQEGTFADGDILTIDALATPLASFEVCSWHTIIAKALALVKVERSRKRSVAKVAGQALWMKLRTILRRDGASNDYLPTLCANLLIALVAPIAKLAPIAHVEGTLNCTTTRIARKTLWVIIHAVPCGHFPACDWLTASVTIVVHFAWDTIVAKPHAVTLMELGRQRPVTIVASEALGMELETFASRQHLSSYHLAAFCTN